MAEIEIPKESENRIEHCQYVHYIATTGQGGRFIKAALKCAQ